jgi:hypothetical protein
MKAINRNTIKNYAVKQIGRVRDEARTNWKEMVEAEAPAGTLATAFAAGTLISTIPVPLVDMALAAYVTRRFSEMPRAPFFTGMAIANNLVMAPLYASTPKVGGLALHWLSANTPIIAPEAFLLRILVGYLLIAMGLALGSFVLASTGFRGYKATRRMQAAPLRFARITRRLDNRRASW